MLEPKERIHGGGDPYIITDGGLRLDITRIREPFLVGEEVVKAKPIWASGGLLEYIEGPIFAGRDTFLDGASYGRADQVYHGRDVPLETLQNRAKVEKRYFTDLLQDRKLVSEKIYPIGDFIDGFSETLKKIEDAGGDEQRTKMILSIVESMATFNLGIDRFDVKNNLHQTRFVKDQKYILGALNARNIAKIGLRLVS